MTIAELAGEAGVSAHTLRYYERAGLVPHVARDPSSGHRRYGPGHVGWIAFLRNLRAAGMPVREMRAYARLVTRGDSTWPERQAILKKHRDRVEATIRQLQAHRRVLDQKVRLGCAPPPRLSESQ